MLLSVVFLSYNTRDLTEQALRSTLAAARGMAVEFFVVDNASVDGSADMVAEKFPQVHLLRNECNAGFAAGNNAALRRVCGRYVLLLNTDTIVRRDTLRRLVDFMEAHPEAGAAGCKILNPDGTLQLDSRRGFPTPLVAFCKMSGLSRLFPRHPVMGRYNMTFLDPERRAEVDVLSGSCMMVRKRAMDAVGLLDEDYFMYGEDIDWCYRIRAAGWKIYYVPDTEIVHFRGESGRGTPLRILYRKSKAMSIFVGKHMRERYRFFPLWLLHVGIALYGAMRFGFGALRALALPLVDAALVLAGIGLGLLVRYHPDLVPLIYRIEQLSNQLGLRAEPTRWLTPPPYSEAQWFAVYATPVVVCLLSLYALGLYGRRRHSPLWAAAGVSLGFALVLALVFFFKAYNFSRLAAAAAWACSTGLVGGWRWGARWLSSRQRTARGRRRQRTLVVGTDGQAERFVRYWEAADHPQCDILGIVRPEGEAARPVVAGRPVVGGSDELASLLRAYDIDTLVFVPGTLALALEHMDERWGAASLRVCMVPISFAEEVSAPARRGELPLVEISPQPPRRAGRSRGAGAGY